MSKTKVSISFSQLFATTTTESHTSPFVFHVQPNSSYTIELLKNSKSIAFFTLFGTRVLNTNVAQKTKVVKDTIASAARRALLSTLLNVRMPDCEDVYIVTKTWTHGDYGKLKLNHLENKINLDCKQGYRWVVKNTTDQERSLTKDEVSLLESFGDIEIPVYRKRTTDTFDFSSTEHDLGRTNTMFRQMSSTLE